MQKNVELYRISELRILKQEKGDIKNDEDMADYRMLGRWHRGRNR